MTAVSWADRPTNMIIDQGPERFDVVVIGGSQAGLAAGFHLSRYELRFVIIDAYDRIGDAWRTRWDSLRLFTPARFTRLPGMPFPGPGNAYPTKDEVADYLERYATTMSLPVRTGIEARQMTRVAGDAWTIEATGQTLIADAVIIATGGYQTPKIPAWATDLDPDVLQLHSLGYRNPAQFQPGPVLVVGASHSGAEIAIEAARNHQTMLVGRDTGQVPIRSDGRLDRLVTPLIWFAVNHVLTVDTPMGRKAKGQFRAHGFPLERTRRSDLKDAGVERITVRATGVRDGKPMLDDGRVLDVTNVVWCTGFQGDYSWIEGLTYGEDGYPEQERGVVRNTPGLYFVGLKFQRTGASSLVGGVGRDAEIVADHIAVRARHTA